MTTAARASAASASPTRIAMVATLFVSVPAKSRGAPGAGPGHAPDEAPGPGAEPLAPQPRVAFPNHFDPESRRARGTRGRAERWGVSGRAGGSPGRDERWGVWGAISGPPTRST